MLAYRLYTDFRDFSQAFSSYLHEIMPDFPPGSLSRKRSPDLEYATSAWALNVAQSAPQSDIFVAILD